MKQNKKAFSLVIAMGIVLVSTLLAYTILEYMIPFSRNVYGVENSTKAYYNASKGIEKGLYFFSTRKNQHIPKEVSISGTGYTLDTTSSGSTLPKSGEGDSEYDSDWNTISIGNPLQLSVGYDFVNIDDLGISFRVPEINGSRSELSGAGYISWQLVGGTGALNSNSGSLIDGSFMNTTTGKNIDIKDLNGTSYDNLGTEVNSIKVEDIFSGNSIFSGVQQLNCDNTSVKCILKFSVINSLETTDGNTLPYIEWRLEDTSLSPKDIPLRYSIINSRGTSQYFGRILEIKVPQDTVNQAFDFAVFQ